MICFTEMNLMTLYNTVCSGCTDQTVRAHSQERRKYGFGEDIQAKRRLKSISIIRAVSQFNWQVYNVWRLAPALLFLNLNSYIAHPLSDSIPVPSFLTWNPGMLRRREEDDVVLCNFEPCLACHIAPSLYVPAVVRIAEALGICRI